MYACVSMCMGWMAFRTTHTPPERAEGRPSCAGEKLFLAFGLGKGLSPRDPKHFGEGGKNRSDNPGNPNKINKEYRTEASQMIIIVKNM